MSDAPCTRCGGRGEVEQQAYDDKGNLVFVWVPCDGCGGSGKR